MKSTYVGTWAIFDIDLQWGVTAIVVISWYQKCMIVGDNELLLDILSSNLCQDNYGFFFHFQFCHSPQHHNKSDQMHEI